MEFNVPKTHELFRQMIREFAEKEVKPLATELDEEERFPVETVKKMAEIGIMGIPIPKEYGGAGGDNLMYAMAVEELSKVCGTTGVVVSAHTSLGTWPILKFGTEAQKQKYLPKLASGEWIGALDALSQLGTRCSRTTNNSCIRRSYSRMGNQRFKNIHNKCRICSCLCNICYD